MSRPAEVNRFVDIKSVLILVDVRRSTATRRNRRKREEVNEGKLTAPSNFSGDEVEGEVVEEGTWQGNG